MVVRIPTRQQLQSALTRFGFGLLSLYMLTSILHYFLLHKYDFLYRMLTYSILSTPLVVSFVGIIRKTFYPPTIKKKMIHPLFVGPVRPRDVRRLQQKSPRKKTTEEGSSNAASNPTEANNILRTYGQTLLGGLNKSGLGSCFPFLANPAAGAAGSGTSNSVSQTGVPLVPPVVNIKNVGSHGSNLSSSSSSVPQLKKNPQEQFRVLRENHVFRQIFFQNLFKI